MYICLDWGDDKLMKISFILTALILMLITGVSVHASGSAASRTIEIYRTEGTVRMTRGSARDFAARAGVMLHDGFTVTTGEGSACYLRLDDGSLIKIDAESAILINQTSRNLLSISVQSGSIAVDAEPQAGGEEVEIRIGNSALAIRGTFFAAEYMADGVIVFTMLEGLGEVDGMYLPAGYIMYIRERTEDTHVLIPLDIDSASMFVLDLILGDIPRFIGTGIIDPDDMERVSALEEARRTVIAAAATTGNPSSPANISGMLIAVSVATALLFTAALFIYFFKTKSGLLFGTKKFGRYKKSAANASEILFPPKIAAVNPPPGKVGTPYNFELIVAGAPKPKITYTGTLPSGLAFVSDTLIFGTPTESGEFTIKITASNSQGYSNRDVAVVVNASSDNA